MAGPSGSCYRSGFFPGTSRRLRSTKAVLFAFVFCWVGASLARAGVTEATLPAGPPLNGFVSALVDGTPYLEERYRYENVDQRNFATDANAQTLRSILGYKTGIYHDVQIDAGLVNVAQFGGHDFNDGSDGRPQFPAIGDPGTTQIYAANLSYTGLPQTVIIGGRQKIDLDNERWVGAANWRQIPQTYDAITGENKSADDLDLFYGHVFHENRPPGDNVTNGTYDMDSDLFHVAYTGAPNVKLIGYSYLTNNYNIRALSSATTGGRVEAQWPIGGGWAFTGNGEYARQFNYGNDPAHFGLNYYLLEPGALFGQVSGKIGYEVLGSNGAIAVQAPMMAPHPMNGWADQFVTTPANGLEDRYAVLAYRFQLPCSWLNQSKIEGALHSFTANRIDQHYGNEYDLDFVQKVATHYAVGTQLADYRADTLLADTRKIILTLQLDY